MGTPITATASYLDFAGLADLKGKAHAGDATATSSAAQQFEGLFIQMMVKAMRDAQPKSDLLESQGMSTYQSLYDKELSLHMAKRGVLGIADMLNKQVAAQQAAPAAADNLVAPAGMVGATARGFALNPPLPTLPLQKPGPALQMPPQRQTEFLLKDQRFAPPAPFAIPADRQER